ncbi:MAG: hypothetical protein KatS3mg057_1144 [Herpetosiphonaceae bacterium]|nr:MAG: hypothetical protein KatS3mg057_1144 [Herpetosiphonaceae bacterium]
MADLDRWKLPGALALGGQRRPGAWLLEAEGGWALVGAPAGTARLLRSAGHEREVRLIFAIDPHRYHTDELYAVATETGAPVYALAEATAALEGQVSPPEVIENRRTPLLWPVGAFFAALGGRRRPVSKVRPLQSGTAPFEAPSLRIYAIEGLAPGSGALIDEARHYLVLAGAASNGGDRLRLAPSREVRDPQAYRRSLSAILSQPLAAVLFQLGPPLAGSAAIDRLRALVIPRE